jgi:hypothetical protein
MVKRNFGFPAPADHVPAAIPCLAVILIEGAILAAVLTILLVLS